MTQKIQAIKSKIDKWDYVKLKGFCTAKKTVNRVKCQPMKREITLANNRSDNDLIYKTNMKLTTQ